MSQAVAIVLVDTEHIISLALLAKLSAARCKSLVYALRRPGGVAQGHPVTESAEHNLSICCAICQYWERCSRNSNAASDIVLDTDLFEEGVRQAELELSWVNSEAGFVPLTEQDIQRNFTLHYEEFLERCNTIRGCNGNPLGYLARQNLIPKPEGNDPEVDYATMDQ